MKRFFRVIEEVNFPEADLYLKNEILEFVNIHPEINDWGFFVNGKFKKRNRYFYD